jgi:hypothetical protein
MTRHPVLGALALLLMAVGVAGATSPPARGAPSPLSLVGIEPLVDDKVVVERVAASTGGSEEYWRLNLDVWVKHNGGIPPVWLRRASVRYSDPPAVVGEATYTRDEAPELRPGQTVKIQMPEGGARSFPVPAKVHITLDFGSETLTMSKTLAEHKNPVAGGAYLFPGKRTDLPDGWYWTDTQNHLYGSNHRKSSSQRFAYDLVIRRWDGKRWVTRKPGKNGTKNSHSLVWDMPVYAVADGSILRCWRTLPDNRKPGVKGDGAGNSLRIAHADGEVALYAHLRQHTMPPELCRREGVNAKFRRLVRAGDYLGRVGNSGHSGGPHLHLHIDTTGDKAGQGRPMHFRNIRTRFAGTDWNKSRHCRPGLPPFAVAQGAGVGWHQLVEPLWKPGLFEVARHRMPEACFNDFVQGMAASGYRPAWFDGYEVAKKPYVNVVFRKDEGGAWLMRHGLDHATFQAEIEKSYAAGLWPTIVESYREGDSLRYAFVAEQRPGPAPTVYHGRTQDQHEKLVQDLNEQGYEPRGVSVVSIKGKLWYTALWDKTGFKGWVLRSTLRSGQYQKWVEDNAKFGRPVAYVNGYNHDGKTWLSAFASTQAKTRVARHGLTEGSYQAAYTTWTAEGLHTRVVTGYHDGGRHLFAALWE